MVMGCYGIGVSRIISAVVEEHHDENGIAWPAALAPYDVHVIAMPGDESLGRSRAARGGAAAAGLDVLYDDREVPPRREVRRRRSRRHAGAAHRRARRASRSGIVERKIRATGERDEIPRAEAVATIAAP